MGFINKMSDLTKYCEAQGVTDFVVGDVWFSSLDTTSTNARAVALEAPA